jgi:hypothetical protein
MSEHLARHSAQPAPLSTPVTTATTAAAAASIVIVMKREETVAAASFLALAFETLIPARHHIRWNHTMKGVSRQRHKRQVPSKHSEKTKK